MPRVNLLIAEDVGLGKTIEAGLVTQELLLRHRARTVLVVCPASLCVKWRDEMAEKFGLEFRIVDTELLRGLRRRQGLYANPWTHYPRLIASIDWLKRDRAQRLLGEVLPAKPTYPRTFDLLIVDEVHSAAPSGRGRYATDSLRTKALRALGPHFEHRLFLSATPHNGYTESFTALLELLDPQRFARGVPPSPEQLRRVMVRRLKSELRAELPPKPDGTPRFPTREIVPLEVRYTGEERAAHAALRRYAESRAQAAEQARGKAGRVAAEFVLTLLKKRLFSSPAAFAHTLDRHVETMTRASATRGAASAKVLAAARDEVEQDFADEDELETAWDAAFEAAERFAAPLTAGERGLVDELRSWASTAADRGDEKSRVLLDWLEGIVRPAGRWTDERVIVFTEYRHTQIWLAERLAARGLAGDRLALLYGGMDSDVRERVKAEFQAHPSLAPVRILLATDAASEGIDLQRHCHRLVHIEIPWNPNRLEQRNGRIDRHGQPSPVVLVHHFVGAGWEHADAGSLEADLQFLLTAARKVEAIRDDLGSVGPVIAERVERAMLGRSVTLDTATTEAASPSRTVLRLQRELREDIERLRERLEGSIAELNLEPATVERVVRVGLELARQPGLRPAALARDTAAPVFEMPRLTGSWARCAGADLEHPVTGERRPITFSNTVADGHDDVVLVHLGHRLVQQALRLLRAEIWATGPAARLGRVTARIVPHAALDQLAAVAHGRLVITGADGRRLHEEVITAAGRVRGGRFARMNVGETDTALAAATARQPDSSVLEALAEAWPAVAEPLANALGHRARTRADSLTALLARRAEVERALDSPLEAQVRALLLAACDNDERVAAEVEPYHALLRRDHRGLPRVWPPGSVYVTAGAERRSTGTYYTPKSLAEETVRHTLELLVYAPGPASGAAPGEWRLKPAAELLDLRICDMAMGSGAFLVAACRYLAERLLEAWTAAEDSCGGEVSVDGRALGPAVADAEVVPAGEEDRRLLAHRMVADRCLFGVDRNPMAAEMAKLSLWLVTLAKDRPFSFLDHALRPGDSLLGITDLGQVEHLHPDGGRGQGRDRPIFDSHWTSLALKEAVAKRRRLESFTIVTIADAEEKARLHREAEAGLDPLRVVADVVIGAALSTVRHGDDALDVALLGVADDVVKALDPARSEVERRVYLEDLRARAEYWLDTDRPDSAPERQCFHWPLEFPEVFLDRGRPGFDAVVGNPPFLGGKRISGPLGSSYREYLVEQVAGGVKGSADLVVYFLLRAAQIVAAGGGVGLLATNTIGQGDTREVGLDRLTSAGWTLYRAWRSRPWPGSANLEVAQVWLRRGRWNSKASLDDTEVHGITPSLDTSSRVSGTAHRLAAAAGRSHIGSLINGNGFTLHPDEAAGLIDGDPRNRHVLFAYVNGQDLNSQPDQSPSRWVINFHDWPLERAEQYPDCLQIVRERVKPQRDLVNREAHRRYWWHYGDKRPALYKAITGLDRVLTITLVSRTIAPAFVPKGIVYSHALAIFAHDDEAHFGLLTSALHWWWAVTRASTMRADLRYTPSDVFETFPQPDLTPDFASAGKALDEHRRALMLDRWEGLTATYNRVHNPGERAADVTALRDLHVALDHAVAAAYG